jgi:TPR repeat protein
MQGNAGAQHNLGDAYYNGKGVAKDYKKAIEWWYKAATQGLWQAQYNLGVMYKNGYGVAKDYRQALYWYKKAAAQGHAGAQKMVDTYPNW